MDIYKYLTDKQYIPYRLISGYSLIFPNEYGDRIERLEEKRKHYFDLRQCELSKIEDRHIFCKNFKYIYLRNGKQLKVFYKKSTIGLL